MCVYIERYPAADSRDMNAAVKVERKEHDTQAN